METKQFKVRGNNVLFFHEHRFLILPAGEVAISLSSGAREVESHDILIVSASVLASAYDITPDLPERVLGSAWQNGYVFASEVDPAWAVSVARHLTGFAGTDILRAFNEMEVK
jgi:hypothetical protein